MSIEQIKEILEFKFKECKSLGAISQCLHRNRDELNMIKRGKWTLSMYSEKTKDNIITKLMKTIKENDIDVFNNGTGLNKNEIELLKQFNKKITK